MILKDFPVFDPIKLAKLLLDLPENSLIFGINATGPLIAKPKSAQDDYGAFVYDDTTISIAIGGGKYRILAILKEADGEPMLYWLGGSGCTGGIK
jgi:hypothetical protein